MRTQPKLDYFKIPKSPAQKQAMSDAVKYIENAKDPLSRKSVEELRRIITGGKK